MLLVEFSLPIALTMLYHRWLRTTNFLFLGGWAEWKIGKISLLVLDEVWFASGLKSADLSCLHCQSDKLFLQTSSKDAYLGKLS